MSAQADIRHAIADYVGGGLPGGLPHRWRTELLLSGKVLLSHRREAKSGHPHSPFVNYAFTISRYKWTIALFKPRHSRYALKARDSLDFHRF